MRAAPAQLETGRIQEHIQAESISKMLGRTLDLDPLITVKQRFWPVSRYPAPIPVGLFMLNDRPEPESKPGSVDLLFQVRCVISRQ